MTIEPDAKDWTWVLGRRCEECGTEVSAYDPPAVAAQILRAADRWHDVLGRAQVRVRPDASTWSPLEYGAHVRDVCEVMNARLALMLAQDNPTFPDWDQDEAAVQGRYAELDPADVAEQILVEAHHVAGSFEAVPEEQWDRPGLRSNGAAFTVRTLAQYLLHDLLHHLHDVRG